MIITHEIVYTGVSRKFPFFSVDGLLRLDIHTNDSSEYRAWVRVLNKSTKDSDRSCARTKLFVPVQIKLLKAAKERPSESKSKWRKIIKNNFVFNSPLSSSVCLFSLLHVFASHRHRRRPPHSTWYLVSIEKIERTASIRTIIKP